MMNKLLAIIREMATSKGKLPLLDEFRNYLILNPLKSQEMSV
jgi:hypothetical protein